jgi:hypothetical protein
VEPFEKRAASEELDLAERRKALYVPVPAQPPQRLAVTAWVAALAILLAVVAFGLYGIRYEYFVMANGGYILRINRITGNVCYMPAEPEWERTLEARQALLNRCDP